MMLSPRLSSRMKAAVSVKADAPVRRQLPMRAQRRSGSANKGGGGGGTPERHQKSKRSLRGA